MKDKILELIRTNGPALPVEVASKIGKDSFIADAYLSELVAEGKLKASPEKIGSVPIYFLQEQEAAARQKFADIKSKSSKTARTFQQGQVAATPEVMQKRQAFEEKVQEILRAEQKVIPKPQGQQAQAIHSQVSPEMPRPQQRPTIIFEKSQESFQKPAQELQTPQSTIIPKRPTLTFVKDSVKEAFAPKPAIEFDLQKDNFESKAIKYLMEHNIEILQKEEGRRELNIIANVPTAVGPIKFLIKVRDKSKINRSDLVLAYTSALEQRMPVLFLTNGIIASSAEKYLKEVGGILKVQVL